MDSLFPILIFVVWIIIFAVANQKKRQKQLEVSRQRQSVGQSQRTSTTPSRPASLSDELKRTLESIYASSSEPADTSTLEEPARAEQKLESATPEGSTLSDLNSSLKKQLRLLEQQKTEHFYNNYDTQTSSALAFTPNELRRGIILSEILAPPVSLRD